MPKPPITAIVLAGGKSTRMKGKNKGLQTLKGKKLIEHVITKISPQVEHILINSNDNIEQYKQLNYPIISDILSGFLGPLAGIHAGLTHSTTEWNLIVSCDTPFLPDDLVLRLWQQKGEAQSAYVFDGEKAHPTILLLNRSIQKQIADYLQQGDRKLLILLNKIKSIQVDFSDKKQSFININTFDELAQWD